MTGEWEKFLVLPRPFPIRPHLFQLAQDSDKISLVQCQFGRQTRTSDAFSWPPKVSLFQLSFMEPLIATQAVAAWPLTVSLLLLPPTKGTEMHASAAWQAAADMIFFAARLSSPPAHWPSGQTQFNYSLV